MLITSMIGNGVGGIICELFGRKSSLILGNGIVLVNWAALECARSFLSLFVARCCMGIGFGIASASSYVLVGEISTASYRISLGTMNSFARNSGILYGVLVGALLPFEHYIIGKGKFLAKM